MEAIVTYVNADLAILLLPAFSFMIYDFMQPNMVLHWYYKLIVKLPTFFQKPLGMCLKCMHVWVCIVYGLIIHIALLKFIILTSLSYLILVKLFYD